MDESRLLRSARLRHFPHRVRVDGKGRRGGGFFVLCLVHRLQAVALTGNVEVQAAEDVADRPRRRDVQPVAPQWTYLERLSG